MLTKERANPVDPVVDAEVQGNQIRAESPGWVEGAAGVVDSGKPVAAKKELSAHTIPHTPVDSLLFLTPLPS